LKEREIKPILRQSPLIVRSAALRSFDFTLLKPDHGEAINIEGHQLVSGSGQVVHAPST
jgi:hypothetical protein